MGDLDPTFSPHEKVLPECGEERNLRAGEKGVYIGVGRLILMRCAA